MDDNDTQSDYTNDNDNPLLDQQHLAEDNDSPAAPADDIHSNAPIDEPSSDDQLDSDELYQEGMAGATNADDQEVSADEEPKPLEPED